MSQPGYDREPAAEFCLAGEVEESREVLYESFLESLRSPATYRSQGRHGRLLDVGCGGGRFIALAGAHGWEAQGIDLDPEACEAARKRGLAVSRTSLKAAAFPDSFFDVVTLWEVLDIMEDPLGHLREAYRIARPGGTIFARVRNGPWHERVRRWGGRARSERIQSFSVLHRHAFSASTLSRALALAGWKDVRVSNSKWSLGAAFFLAAPGWWRGGVRMAAGGWNCLSRLIAAATAGGFLAAPSIEAVARKPGAGSRVLHVITRLDVGGSSENVLLSARGLMREGYEVLVACGPSAQLSREAVLGGVHCRVLPALVRELRPLADSAAFFQIARLILEWKPDIVHTHSSKAGFLGRLAAEACRALWRRRLSVVHTPHGHVFYGYFGPWRNRIFLALERALAPGTQRLVALTEGEKRECVERGVGRERQWAVIHSGVRAQTDVLGRDEARKLLMERTGIVPVAFVVGTVARLEPVKGVEFLIRAAPQVARMDPRRTFRFVVVGDGVLRGSLEGLAARLGARDAVVFAGLRDDVSQWMRAMDVYVQPSLNEGMGKTVVQAQGLG
ncbi:MAG: glycosyltransferase, partial [Elusimicrobia bacterium]|nr:glycosyltransferase [Elusimicrobiota bacterium]